MIVSIVVIAIIRPVPVGEVGVVALNHITAEQKIVLGETDVSMKTLGEFVYGHSRRMSLRVETGAEVGVLTETSAAQTTTASDSGVEVPEAPMESVLVTAHLHKLHRLIHLALQMVQPDQITPTIVLPAWQP